MHERVIQEIRRRLKEKNLTPISAAKKAGLGRDSIRDILRGKSQQPSYGTLKKLADVLDCTVSELEGVTDGIVRDAKLGQQRALETYTRFQRTLYHLFRDFTRLDDDDAAIIFYGAGSSQARLSILDQLKKRHRPKDFSQFWRSLVLEIAKVDLAYIEIVRWKPHFEALRPEDYDRFVEYCGMIDFAAHLFANWAFRHRGGSHKELVAEILSRPLTWPLPDDHPLPRLVSELSSAASKEPDKFLGQERLP